MEYSLFTKKLSNKCLTINQIHYLYNTILLSYVKYRLKAIMLSEKDCKDIMSPMKKLFMHHISISIPDAFLYSNFTLNLLIFSLDFSQIMLTHLKHISSQTMT